MILPGKSDGRRWTLPIFLAAVAGLKLAVLWQLKDHPLLHPDAGLDTTAYAELARRVAAGDVGLGPGLYYVSPLYIYVLAAGLATTGSFSAVRIGQVLLGTAAVGLIFAGARAWFGTRAAWLSAILAALTGLFTFFESLILQASIDVFLTSAALAALAAGLVRGRTPLVVLGGLAFGIQALNRPNIPIAVAAMVLACLAARRVRPAAALACGMLIGLSPVLARNVVVTGQWSLVSSHGGLNLYIGNNETATGFYRQVPGVSPTIAGQKEDTRRIAEQAAGRPLTDAETSRYFTGLALAWMRDHPADAAALFARKLAYVFNAQHVALPHSYPFYAHDERTALRFLAVGPWLLVPLGLAGLVFAARRRCAAAAAASPDRSSAWPSACSMSARPGESACALRRWTAARSGAPCTSHCIAAP